VDHVERGGLPSPEGPANSSTFALKAPESAAEPAISPNKNEIETRVIQKDEVDRGYIASLELAAHSGQPVASQNAAMAHHAASQFELSHGEMELALADARTALTYAPEQPVLLMDVAYLHLRRSEFTQSLDYLERARRVAPDDPEISKLAGWAYYGLNKMDQAVAEWKRSESLRPDAEVQAALKKALRDKQEEEKYSENESNHFKLRYSGASAPSLARDVLQTLEKHFSAIEGQLGYSPPEQIGVILYTQEAFADITRAPKWVSALNDGRLRVPVQGLSEMTPELSRVLKHELTHSFIQQKTQSHAPTWIQEGMAQWMEGQRSGTNAAVLVKRYESDPAASMKHYQGEWMKMSREDVDEAYAWALANIEYLIQSGGMGDVDKIVDRMAAGELDEDAVKDVRRSDFAELNRETVEYLRKTYGN
jgi:tetratricopeptide (TPR) repeat protein